MFAVTCFVAGPGGQTIDFRDMVEEVSLKGLTMLRRERSGRFVSGALRLRAAR